MVLIPCILLAVFSPGYLFPQMAARMATPSRIRLFRKRDSEKPSQSKDLEGQQQAVNGTEKGIDQEKANDHPVSTSTTVEPKSAESI